MPRSGINGTYNLPPNTDNQVPNTPISSSMFNAFADDVEQTNNTVVPEAYGGTGASTYAGARANLGADNAANLISGLLAAARIPDTLTSDKAFRTGNILAALTSGGLLEYGINGNGDYLKFRGGLIICLNRNIPGSATNIAFGSVWRSDTISWTYPVAFNFQPIVYGGVNNSFRWVTGVAASATSCNFKHMDAASSATVISATGLAIGF